MAQTPAPSQRPEVAGLDLIQFSLYVADDGFDGLIIAGEDARELFEFGQAQLAAAEVFMGADHFVPLVSGAASCCSQRLFSLSIKFWIIVMPASLFTFSAQS